MLKILKFFVESRPFFVPSALQELEAPRQLRLHETSAVVGAPEVQNEPDPT